MMTGWMKRALPFIVTLILGTGLGSIFGVHTPNSNGIPTSRSRFVERHDIEAAYSSTTNGATHVKILYEPRTRFTPEALKNRTTGVVILKVLFKADGTTSVRERFSTLPDGLTEDAERVVKYTRFTPASINGTTFDDTRVMSYIYSLSDTETSEP